MLELSSKYVGAAPNTAELLKGGICLEPRSSCRGLKTVNLVQIQDYAEGRCCRGGVQLLSGSAVGGLGFSDGAVDAQDCHLTWLCDMA